MIVGGAAEAVSFPVAECRVPEGIDGPGQSHSTHPASSGQRLNERFCPVLVFITNSATPLAANIVTQDKEAIVAGTSPPLAACCSLLG